MENEQPKKRATSRRKNTGATVLSSDMSGLSSNYCRKCQRLLPESKFHKATDLLLDSNGKMSICKACCDSLYDSFYSSEGSLEKAIYRMCKTLNVVYDEDAVERTKNHLDTLLSKGTMVKSPYGVYFSKVMSKINGSMVSSYTFVEPLRSMGQSDITEEEMSEYNNVSNEDVEILRVKWGKRYSLEDLIFLERELTTWQDSYKHDTKAEQTLLEDLCHKEWEIRKARDEGSSTAALVKEKQDLMKTASIDPAQANKANSGKNKELFSMYIKDIEENEPAEFFEKRKKFKDWDNIGWYMNNFFIRAVKNFILQSKDFNLTEKEEDTSYIEGSLVDYVEEELE